MTTHLPDGAIPPSKAPSRPPSTEVQVFTPFRRGLPKVGPYLAETWARRHFAIGLARTQLRGQHFNTGFGQLWLVLNPLLLAGVYFLLVSILGGGRAGPDRFAHIVAGLFAFYFFAACLSGGSASVVGGGRLILNTAFPKILLPLAAVAVALMRFLPTLFVYAVVHISTGQPVGWQTLWAIPAIVILAIFGVGCALLLSTLNVYFRDTQAFLPYVLRVWLYASPVLYYPEAARQVFAQISAVNPLFAILGTWGDAVVRAEVPNPWSLMIGAAWALGTLSVGFLFFLSREREFAVRI
jgi:teichoic acid transport system permease protein